MLLAEPIAPFASAIAIGEAAQPTGWNDYVRAHRTSNIAYRGEWLSVFAKAFRHRPYYLEARQDGRLKGILPLAVVQGPLFGRMLSSLPYLNTGGVLADSDDIARRLIDRAVQLADSLNVKHLELRHEHEIEHPGLTQKLTSKVHLRLPLPKTAEALWDGFKSKLRSQVKKPLANADLSVHWGRHDLLSEFYDVFCANMRDLGTPPYTRTLFAEILATFADEAELCVVRHQGRPVSGALVLHGPGSTQIPSASTLRSANKLAANMLMYWRLLERAVQRGQHTFDFGRSTLDAGTYQFKKQWGALDEPAVWQYYVRAGSISDLRPEGGKYDLFIRLWKRLPIAITRILGPGIVRGIP